MFCSNDRAVTNGDVTEGDVTDSGVIKGDGNEAFVPGFVAQSNSESSNSFFFAMHSIIQQKKSLSLLL